MFYKILFDLIERGLRELSVGKLLGLSSVELENISVWRVEDNLHTLVAADDFLQPGKVAGSNTIADMEFVAQRIISFITEATVGEGLPSAPPIRNPIKHKVRVEKNQVAVFVIEEKQLGAVIPIAGIDKLIIIGMLLEIIGSRLQTGGSALEFRYRIII